MRTDLESYLHTCNRAFDWRSNNCCHFVSRWVTLRTGLDPMEGLCATPGVYSARRLIKKLGGSLIDAWDDRSGLERCDVRTARTGDIVRMPTPRGGEALGICSGRHSVFLAEEDTLVALPIEDATHAWRTP